MKINNRTIIAASVAALIVTTPLSSWAKETKATAPAPAASVAPSSVTRAKHAIPYHGKISAIDQAAKTFSIPGLEKARVFTVTETTVITKDGTPATIADVLVDEDVRGSYWKRSDGSLEAKSVKLGLKTDAESKSKRKKKDKSESDAAPKS